MRVLGIDPGMAGAIVFDGGRGLICWDMPTISVQVAGKNRKRLDVQRFRSIVIDAGAVDMVVLEEAQSQPTDGGKSAFAYGRSFGQIEGVLAALDRPVTLVRPQAWTKALGVGSDKGTHVLTAQRLYPTNSDLFVGPKGGLIDGRADAALLAHWWTRQ